jgi:hypothetical protein
MVSLLGASAACASPAAAATLALREVGPAASAPVADGRSGLTAYLRAPGELVVRGDDGRATAFAVPADCVPAALSREAVGLSCGAAARPAVVSLPGGAVGPLSLPARLEGRATVVSMGTKWLELEARTDPDASGKTSLYRALVDLRSGAVVGLRSDAFGRNRRLDLDRARVRLRDCARPCAGRRTRAAAWTGRGTCRRG